MDDYKNKKAEQVLKENIPDLNIATYCPKHEIGALYCTSDSGIYKYVKIIFGIYPEGDAYLYQWTPWNGLAKLKEWQKTIKGD